MFRPFPTSTCSSQITCCRRWCRRRLGYRGTANSARCRRWSRRWRMWFRVRDMVAMWPALARRRRSAVVAPGALSPPPLILLPLLILRPALAHGPGRSGGATTMIVSRSFPTGFIAVLESRLHLLNLVCSDLLHTFFFLGLKIVKITRILIPCFNVCRFRKFPSIFKTVVIFTRSQFHYLNIAFSI